MFVESSLVPERNRDNPTNFEELFIVNTITYIVMSVNYGNCLKMRIPKLLDRAPDSPAFISDDPPH